MRIKKSQHIKGWIGFFQEDENGYPEEFMSVKTIEKAERIVEQLQKDLTRLRSKSRIKDRKIS